MLKNRDLEMERMYGYFLKKVCQQMLLEKWEIFF